MNKREQEQRKKAASDLRQQWETAVAFALVHGWITKETAVVEYARVRELGDETFNLAQRVFEVDDDLLDVSLETVESA